MKQYNLFDNEFMFLAFEEAKKAFEEDEIPVGCVIVSNVDKSIITTSRNIMQKANNPNYHAEILAINFACFTLGNKNLFECDIYTTLEPCTMCAAAIANARIKRIYYAAANIKQGAIENGIRFFNSPYCFHRPEIYSGIFEQESVNLMQRFFSKIRDCK